MPKVTFGIIVLNGEPFTRYCLRSLYPFAHEIIVVEGGHEDTRSVATPDGHSVDGTLDVLRRFCAEEDPQHKVTLVTKDGFWPKKDELGRNRTPQSRAYAERATGDYLWQVDSDEFYMADDMRRVLEMLACDPEITAVSFRERGFWGDLDIEVQGWPHQRPWHRLFKWGPDYRYVTHEPPTVVDETGRDLRNVKWMKHSVMARRGIFLYHYVQLFPWQVDQKTRIYTHEDPDYRGSAEWAKSGYTRLDHPYRVHRHYQRPSWLRRYHGDHPAEVLRMMDDVRSGRVDMALRDNRDAHQLLEAWWYPVGAHAFSCLDYVDQGYHWTRVNLGKLRHWRERSRWLLSFERDHPEEAQRIIEDIRVGRIETALGENLDAYHLLESRVYRAGARVLSCLDTALDFIRGNRWFSARSSRGNSQDDGLDDRP